MGHYDNIYEAEQEEYNNKKKEKLNNEFKEATFDLSPSAQEDILFFLEHRDNVRGMAQLLNKLINLKKFI